MNYKTISRVLTFKDQFNDVSYLPLSLFSTSPITRIAPAVDEGQLNNNPLWMSKFDVCDLSSLLDIPDYAKVRRIKFDWQSLVFNTQVDITRLYPVLEYTAEIRDRITGEWQEYNDRYKTAIDGSRAYSDISGATDTYVQTGEPFNRDLYYAIRDQVTASEQIRNQKFLFWFRDTNFGDYTPTPIKKEDATKLTGLISMEFDFIIPTA